MRLLIKLPKLKEDDIFRTIIPLENASDDGKNYTENYTENYTKNLNQTQRKILELIKLNPEVTQKVMMQELKLSRSAITLNLKYMKVERIIERVGSDRKGCWKIISRN